LEDVLVHGKRLKRHIFDQDLEGEADVNRRKFFNIDEILKMKEIYSA